MNRPPTPFGYSYKAGPNLYALDQPNALIGTDGRTMSASCRLASTVRDREGDILEVAGIELDNHRENPTVLVDHGINYNWPIAQCETPDGIYTVKIFADKGECIQTSYFSQNSLVAAQIYQLVMDGDMRGNSIGYRPILQKALEPDPERGFYRKANGKPAGLHILRCELIEACVHGDTRIPTKDGLLAIKDMVGTSPTVLTERGWRQCEVVISKGLMACQRLVMRSGIEIIAADKHSFRMFGGGELFWSAAYRIQPGEMILARKDINSDPYFETVASIESAGEHEVFDPVNVQETHSYVSNGLVSHNTWTARPMNPDCVRKVVSRGKLAGKTLAPCVKAMLAEVDPGERAFLFVDANNWNHDSDTSSIHGKTILEQVDKAYNPSQPRARDGKWGAGGNSSSKPGRSSGSRGSGGLSESSGNSDSGLIPLNPDPVIGRDGIPWLTPAEPTSVKDALAAIKDVEAGGDPARATALMSTMHLDALEKVGDKLGITLKGASREQVKQIVKGAARVAFDKSKGKERPGDARPALPAEAKKEPATFIRTHKDLQRLFDKMSEKRAKIDKANGKRPPKAANPIKKDGKPSKSDDKKAKDFLDTMSWGDWFSLFLHGHVKRDGKKISFLTPTGKSYEVKADKPDDTEDDSDDADDVSTDDTDDATDVTVGDLIGLIGNHLAGDPEAEKKAEPIATILISAIRKAAGSDGESNVHGKTLLAKDAAGPAMSAVDSGLGGSLVGGPSYGNPVGLRRNDSVTELDSENQRFVPPRFKRKRKSKGGHAMGLHQDSNGRPYRGKAADRPDRDSEGESRRQERGNDRTPRTDDHLEDDDEDEGSGHPYGAQVLKAKAMDMADHVKTYQKAMKPLEHEGTKRCLMKCMKGDVENMKAMEKHWNKTYKADHGAMGVEIPKFDDEEDDSDDDSGASAEGDVETTASVKDAASVLQKKSQELAAATAALESPVVGKSTTTGTPQTAKPGTSDNELSPEQEAEVARQLSLLTDSLGKLASRLPASAN